MTRRILVVLVLLAIAAFLFTKWPLQFSSGPVESGAPGVSASRTVEQIYFGPRNSLAVLPPGVISPPEPLPEPLPGPPPASFTDLAEGLALELINRLAAERGLQVLSANSSFHFAQQDLEPRIIAERLQVRHLLTLDVTQDGEALKVSLELVDARRESQVMNETLSQAGGQWSQVTERMAAAVLDAMNIRIRSTAAPPVTDAAWLPYLEGLGHVRNLRWEQAQAAFTRSIEAQADFAPAQAGLARVSLSLPPAADSEDPLQTAREALQAALAADPANGRALSLLSLIDFRYGWAFAQALVSAQGAVESLPGDAAILSRASSVALSQGDFEQAVEWAREAVDRDPLNLLLRLSLGHAQEYAGAYDDALLTYRQAIILNPDVPGAGAYRARIKLLQEKPQVALEESEAEPDPFWARYARLLALFALEREDEALPLLQEMIEEDGPRAACQVAEIQAFRGQPDLAFEWLETALRQRDGGMAEIAGNRFFNALHGDPRWPALLDRLGLPLLDSAGDSD